MRKQMFKGDSGRTQNVGSGIEEFGKYSAIVRQANVTASLVELDDEHGWQWIGANGCSGGLYGSEEEAMRNGIAWMVRQGYTDNQQGARESAIAAAQKRHREHCERSDSYRKHFGERA